MNAWSGERHLWQASYIRDALPVLDESAPHGSSVMARVSHVDRNITSGASGRGSPVNSGHSIEMNSQGNSEMMSIFCNSKLFAFETEAFDIWLI